MCTAISFRTKDRYFGRTLDLEYHYNESVVITPRKFPFRFTSKRFNNNHPAIIGTATVVDGYPLYYEATNEYGLSVAGLNFPHNARYFPVCSDKENVAPYEFIPWILCQFSGIGELTEELSKINLADIDFNRNLKASPLHWIVSGSDGCITIESTDTGLNVYKNPAGVLANNPPFPLQIKHLERIERTLGAVENDPQKASKGLDMFGLPGDFSSPSRFVRAAIIKKHSVCGEDEDESVTQFFHMLGCVNTPTGIIRTDSDELYKTVYTSCCNADKGIFYYTTYGNTQISSVDMYKENLTSDTLVSYPLVTKPQINSIN